MALYSRTHYVASCLMLFSACYAQNYAGIIGTSLIPTNFMIQPQHSIDKKIRQTYIMVNKLMERVFIKLKVRLSCKVSFLERHVDHCMVGTKLLDAILRKALIARSTFRFSETPCFKISIIIIYYTFVYWVIFYCMNHNLHTNHY